MASIVVTTSVSKPIIRRVTKGVDTPRIFVLSPANMSGARAQLLLNPKAPFALARKFRSEGLTLAEVFTFTSGLYFRGKIAYARHFASANRKDLIRIITSNGGLVDPDTRVGPAEIAAYGRTEIDPVDPCYHKPLRRDALMLERRMKRCQVILLGSIATPKYRHILIDVFGERLVFPRDFIGRGDMSRGALLLRAIREDQELPYAAVRDAVLTGPRAARVMATELKVKRMELTTPGARAR